MKRLIPIALPSLLSLKKSFDRRVSVGFPLTYSYFVPMNDPTPVLSERRILAVHTLARTPAHPR
jgi:hypothetical protein